MNKQEQYKSSVEEIDLSGIEVEFMTDKDVQIEDFWFTETPIVADDSYTFQVA
ncbi:MAG: hypothetical protein ACWA5R_02530 [bacterium]